MTNAADIGRKIVDGPMRPLTQKESMVLLQLSFACEEPVEVQIEMYREIAAQSQALSILDGRFRLHFGDTVTFSPPMMIWLSTLADRPGNVVLLLAVLAYVKAQGRELTLDSLVNHCFAVGVPTDENYRLAWDAQKTNEKSPKFKELQGFGHDNVLDYKEAWE